MHPVLQTTSDHVIPALPTTSDPVIPLISTTSDHVITISNAPSTKEGEDKGRRTI